MKGVGMLVVSLRGINFGCWSHLACAGQNAIIFSREGLDQDCTQKIYIVCVLSWSLSGVKKSLGPFQIGLLQGFNLKFPTSIPTPFICGVPPGKILRTFVWWGAQTCPPPIIQTSVYIAFVLSILKHRKRGQVSRVRSIIIQLQATLPLNGLFYKVTTQNCLTESDIR